VRGAATRLSYSGLNTRLTSEDCALLLSDHQGAQFANLHSHEPQLVVNNAVALGSAHPGRCERAHASRRRLHQHAHRGSREV